MKLPSTPDNSVEVKFYIQFMVIFLRVTELTWAVKPSGIKYAHLGSDFYLI